MKYLSALAALLFIASAQAETIRVAIGTQDTTINCATGGLLIRELKLLEKYLPHDGKYKDAKYDIIWKNFTSGAPLTNEMVAGKLDIGSMADFPGSANAAAFQKAGKRSVFVTVLSGSTLGSGNGIVVPKDSPITSLAELKGKTLSVPFASTAHGMLLRAVQAQGLDPSKDLNIVAQPPEVAGPALQTGKIEAHADFVPFAELFAYRGFARKIYDGAQANTPTFHGSLVDAAYAEKYPEVVVAFLRAAIEAESLIAAEPEKYSELIEKLTGVEAAVSYLYHGPLGLQTRDFSWKPEFRQALQTSIDTLKLLRRTDTDLDAARLIDDRYIREAYKLSGLDYDARLKNYAKHPLQANDALTGKPIADTGRVADIWVRGEPKVRHYAAAETAFTDLRKIEAAGHTARAVYVHDLKHGIKLLAPLAYFVAEPQGQIAAFLQKDEADAYAREHGGKLRDYASLRSDTAQTAGLDTRFQAGRGQGEGQNRK
ncbi:ABC transporter substrate-binding protein [Methylococcus sp. EFPC2]|uniref:ABC transporter substrate-binding protein n=1 Tax=Methylococcus sp. EFPC2 TaxID=2812648 RepID=UPI0019682C02|nr:ABC transporter substrate-binding protein [Methylococcus sp. EFPC2]QSA98429.1 ABC transporter substrate-binding protein [Methylococcus sp. EFPC2]